jgi:hypothetical protein
MLRTMTRQVSSQAEAFRKRIASFHPRSPRSEDSLENSLLQAYMGFIRESEMPMDRFVSHGGWLLEQSRVSSRLSGRLLRKSKHLGSVHPRLAKQLQLLATFLADPPSDAPATLLRETAFAAYFVLNAPGALIADHAAVVETALQMHGSVLRRFCRLRRLPWTEPDPRQAA